MNPRVEPVAVPRKASLRRRIKAAWRQIGGLDRRRAAGLDSPLRRDKLARTKELGHTLRVGSLFAAITMIVAGVDQAARYPDHASLLISVWTTCGLGSFVLYLAAGRASQRLIVPLTVLLTVLPAVALLLTALEPKALLGVVGGFTILPVAVPLFLAWRRAVRTAWALTYLAVFTAFTMTIGFGYMTGIQRVDVATDLLIGCVIGWVGGELLERLRERNLAQENELMRLNRKLLVRATTDALTGLANRRQLDNDLEILSASRATDSGSYAFIMLDLDQFKRLNDDFGHAVGDAALQAVSGELTRVVRAGDTIYRYGGEEFLVIMPNASLAEASGAAERIRMAVAGLHIETAPDKAPTSLTISGGVAFSTLARERWQTVLAGADAALYQAKATGRNRICMVSSAVADNSPIVPLSPHEPGPRVHPAVATTGP